MDNEQNAMPIKNAQYPFLCKMSKIMIALNAIFLGCFTIFNLNYTIKLANEIAFGAIWRDNENICQFWRDLARFKREPDEH
jgi:hypothetical protein